MEIHQTDSSKERQLRVSTPQAALSKSSEREGKLSAIILQLTKLGIRRQAKLDDADYLLLADDLSKCDMRDIEAGLTHLAQQPREPGETAFPDLGSMLSRINWAANRRLEAEDTQRRNEEREAKERHMREHPEEYGPIGKQAERRDSNGAA